MSIPQYTPNLAPISAHGPECDSLARQFQLGTEKLFELSRQNALSNQSAKKLRLLGAIESYLEIYQNSAAQLGEPRQHPSTELVNASERVLTAFEQSVHFGLLPEGHLHQLRELLSHGLAQRAGNDSKSEAQPNLSTTDLESFLREVLAQLNDPQRVPRSTLRKSEINPLAVLYIEKLDVLCQSLCSAKLDPATRALYKFSFLNEQRLQSGQDWEGPYAEAGSALLSDLSIDQLERLYHLCSADQIVSDFPGELLHRLRADVQDLLARNTLMNNQSIQIVAGELVADLGIKSGEAHRIAEGLGLSEEERLDRYIKISERLNQVKYPGELRAKDLLTANPELYLLTDRELERHIKKLSLAFEVVARYPLKKEFDPVRNLRVYATPDSLVELIEVMKEYELKRELARNNGRAPTISPSKIELQSILESVKSAGFNPEVTLALFGIFMSESGERYSNAKYLEAEGVRARVYGRVGQSIADLNYSDTLSKLIACGAILTPKRGECLTAQSHLEAITSPTIQNLVRFLMNNSIR